jgi:hypothetical protein
MVMTMLALLLLWASFGQLPSGGAMLLDLGGGLVPTPSGSGFALLGVAGALMGMELWGLVLIARNRTLRANTARMGSNQVRPRSAGWFVIVVGLGFALAVVGAAIGFWELGKTVPECASTTFKARSCSFDVYDLRHTNSTDDKCNPASGCVTVDAPCKTPLGGISGALSKDLRTTVRAGRFVVAFAPEPAKTIADGGLTTISGGITFVSDGAGKLVNTGGKFLDGFKGIPVESIDWLSVNPLGFFKDFGFKRDTGSLVLALTCNIGGFVTLLVVFGSGELVSSGFFITMGSSAFTVAFSFYISAYMYSVGATAFIKEGCFSLKDISWYVHLLSLGGVVTGIIGGGFGVAATM